MQPQLIVIGGPNGAGKTTCAMTLLPEFFQVKHFVNADLIANGISPFDSSLAEIQAAKVMVRQMHELRDHRENFAIETTLASKSIAVFIRSCKTVGYDTSLIYVALDSVETALRRVALRVKKGGHNIPEETVRRRYQRSIKNLFAIYMPIVDHWAIMDNTLPDNKHRLIAALNGEAEPKIFDLHYYRRLEELSKC
ncbi:hypothetical protein FACS1894170_03790 [Planctomycetales bacterium]|nr:hypothetical protein FACS1894170_03790 [Planctomycetales bacterium]